MSQLARRVFMHLRDEGGWWSAHEVAQALGLPRHGLAQCILSMVQRGHIVARPATRCDMEAPGYVRTFGVTAQCVPPIGCRLEPTP